MAAGRFESTPSLKDKRERFLSNENPDKENELLKMLDELSEKLKQLENNKNLSTKTRSPFSLGFENSNCDFKHTCYAAKFNMGSCPCELRQSST